MEILNSETESMGQGAWIHREQNTMPRSHSDCIIHNLSDLTREVGNIYRSILLIGHMEAVHKVASIAETPGSGYEEGTFNQLHADAAATAALRPLDALLSSAFHPLHANARAFRRRMRPTLTVTASLCRYTWNPSNTWGMISTVTGTVEQALPVSLLARLHQGTQLVACGRAVCYFPSLDIFTQYTTPKNEITYPSYRSNN